ncbi:hypothetical protein ROR02_03900 [Pararhodospirillum oryzae]|uniref:Uncharacterized protein n=1 Tax=Pararhodospirillum oryzae TaxID=478448 RepID=A0A512H460_9PROT|nr:hypothetical protein ROR02_03900 [Pararhodospirillum oryzae]
MPSQDRRDDPYYAHFPTLKSLLLDTVSGRRAGALRQIAETASLFQNWDTDMRYAPTVEIEARWVKAWKNSAEELLSQMDAL